MFLCDVTIKELLRSKKLLVKPEVKEKNIRPAGIRVHLDKELIQYKTGQLIDPMQPDEILYKKISMEKQPFILEPGAFILGATIESFKMPRDMLGVLDGRSTIARLGVTIHITATITDSLYEDERTITLEIKNAGNLRIALSFGMPIGSMLFAMLDHPVEQSTQNQYKNQKGVVAANLGEQFS
ncbi:MAG: dCTP deaminase [Francisellaceae bacterium]|jgi:dCTP deaminase|nr:dCTP deaminase [Francisellaceae bacterium]MBT6207737.1 dCTP deaminase [Francisellaceae bacterium]MBT6539869.1 dCTP deaminase [Francisellaceae bacterium]